MIGDPYGIAIIHSDLGIFGVHDTFEDYLEFGCLSYFFDGFPSHGEISVGKP